MKAALAEGWELALVIDNGSRKPVLKILAAGGFKNAIAAQQHVVAKARERSALHIAALRAVMNT